MELNRRKALILGAAGFGLAGAGQALAQAAANTVPVSVEAEGATEILMLATGNPTPGVMVASFGPAAGKHALATRIRLAKTQDVVAIAKLADGNFAQAKSNVKVTIGGCGG